MMHDVLKGNQFAHFLFFGLSPRVQPIRIITQLLAIARTGNRKEKN